jgi:hypothetical protein
MLRHIIPVVSKYINPVFVETGTYQGDGVETALSIGFQKVISIELFEVLYTPVKEKFKNDSRVTLHCGDSSVILWDAIKDIDEKITFWLDGHVFPNQEIILGVKACPLIEELAHIARHPVKDHVILIDDMSSLPKGCLYKTTTFTRKDVEDAILHINDDYKISYFDRGGTDVLVASCSGRP